MDCRNRACLRSQTFNEEKAILPLMQHLSQLQPAVHQVLVADGNSGDRCAAHAVPPAASDLRHELGKREHPAARS